MMYEVLAGMLLAHCLCVTGINLSPCDTNNQLQLVETKSKNEVTCSGFEDSENVAWFVTLPTKQVDAGNCNANTRLCTNFGAIGYTATRPSASVSVMTIDPVLQDRYVKGGVLICRATRATAPFEQQTTNCTLDIVSLPLTVTCSVQQMTRGTPWTVTGQCNVTKIYSHLGSYSCQWYRRQLTATQPDLRQQVSMTTIPTNNKTFTGENYVNGRCDASMPWPTDDDYIYSVHITPGNDRDVETLTFRTPAPKHNCSLYVADGQILNCMCSDTVGSPPGIPFWKDYSDSAQLVLNVQKSFNGTQYQCTAIWNGATVQPDIYTVHLASGPDSALAAGPNPFDTNGSRDMTLTCSASVSKPSPTFLWTRIGSSEGPRQGQNYTFKPQPPSDDGAVLQCRAQNTVSSKEAMADITVNLHYPPTTDPVITKNSTDGNLYQGDSVTITCTVTGGKPVNATTVTLNCPRTQGAEGTAGPTGVISNVTINFVSIDYHNEQCVCNTQWKGTSWYTRSIQISLLVNAPPSSPVITSPTSDYPPIAGVTSRTTLTCVSTFPGWPPATYTWSAYGGVRAVSSEGNSTLTFDTLSREDDGMLVTCKASNLYIVNRQPVADGRLLLKVYYHPDIILSAQEGTNACYNTKQSMCEVTEGQRVHFRCNATSNPAPDVFTWNQDGGKRTMFSDLYIAEANHTVHNKKYTCTVTTIGLSNKRQPLTSSQDLTVVVKYKPVITHLTLNAQRKNLTIYENEVVVLACQADGRPTPNMELRGGPVAESSRGGVTVLEDRDTLYNYTFTAQCQHTGQYKCTASNSVGEGPTDTGMLFVNCNPRKSDIDSLEIPTVHYVNTPQEVSFNLVAYPIPDNFTFSYLGPSPDNRSQTTGPVTSNTLQMKCFTKNLLYSVTCNVTVDNITSKSEAGLYRVNVSNAFGLVDFEFMITFNESMADPLPSTEPSIPAAIGGGIAAAVVVMIVGAVIGFFIRRQRKGSEDSARGCTTKKKCDTIKLATPEHSGDNSTHDEAAEADVKSHRKPTAVVSPKRKSKSRTHHGKAGAVYENVELNRPARHRNAEHLSKTSTEHSTSANQLMRASVGHLNHLSTADPQAISSSSIDHPANPSANTHTASPVKKKHILSPSAHQTREVPPARQHSSTKHSQKPSSTHTEVTPADADDYEEMERADHTEVSEKALYNDVEYMTSQGATLGLDWTQQYLLDKLRGSHINDEFVKLLTGHQRDCNVGSKGENRSKNRFNNSILPYDANRVALLGESNDYINASRIQGYSSSKSYIAAQGPKKTTVIDFWKMVWQENITHIVMLTNLTEGEKVKCAEYWPPNGKHIRYGSVIVTSIDIYHRSNYVVRTFEIKGSGDGPSRHVSQYHFITWLDHSIPSATALVDFWRTVTTSHRNQTKPSPLLIHCSAGVGRTGTFIALDIAMDTVGDGAEVSIFDVIQRMREDRVNMVQTVSQYRFVHEAILEAYTSRHARLALLAFNSFFPNDIDPNKRIDKLDNEFKLLNQMKVLLHKPSNTVALSAENVRSNRTFIFPDDNHLVYLSTYVNGRNQYINAVLMPTFCDRRGSLLTQLPLQDTLVDIWRLVDGNDVRTIVSIGEEVDGAETKCCYWPRKDGESTKYGPFTVTLISKAALGKYLTTYELSIQLKNSSDSREVSLLQYRGWTGEVPDSTQDLLQLVDLVNSRSVRDHEDEEDKEASPVVLQCLDGATKSGLFRVICDVISRMTYDHDVDVYMAVRHVQIVRPESVTSEMQYRYIYHVIQEYQRRNAVYNN